MSIPIIVVTTQEELDTALAADTGQPRIIRIDSPRGVWLTVEAYGSATVEAYGSATVRAYGSATVEASGSATVEASGSATVRAYGSATVRASKYVAIHLFSQRVTIDGSGHVIDLIAIDLGDPATWCEYHGVTITDGIAYVYKAVDQNWKSHYGADYTPGSIPEAVDWKPTIECGKGLHFGYTPQRALDSAASRIENPRFLRCGIRLDESVIVGDKIKARRVVDACVAVDRNGDVVALEVGA